MDDSNLPRLSRRRTLQLGVMTASLTAAAPVAAATAASPPGRSRSVSSVGELEQRYGVQVGLYAENLSTGRKLRHREHQRFPMLSTFKPLAVAVVLRDRDHGGDLLRRSVHYSSSEVVVNSPITSQRSEMTVAELCDAALRYSDNTAGNLLLREIGGPDAITDFARSVGDRVTRLDRWEPELNEAAPDDQRDTSTPAGLAATYRKLLRGRALPVEDRWLLRAWMQGNLTSGTRLRAGLPAGWTLADKTGAGAYTTLNNVGIATLLDGTEVVISAMSRSADPDRAADNGLMADIAALVVNRLA